MFNPRFTKEQIIRAVKDKCPKPIFNVDCEEFIAHRFKQGSRTPGYKALKTLWLSWRRARRSPAHRGSGYLPGLRSTRMAGVSFRVDWKRPCNKDETFLFDEHDRPFMSEDCGNVPFPLTPISLVAQEPPVPPTAAQAPEAEPTTSKVDTVRVVVTKNSVTVKSPFGQRNVRDSLEMSLTNHLVVKVIVKDIKRGPNRLERVGFFTAGAVVGYVFGHEGGACQTLGSPVNPPNERARIIIPLARIVLRLP
ncbi:hypothetical protein EPN83_00180 [Patescibacteria group bacterium]|nr:MAG: hypothetical protein EPN83_00180 [Patescibacteria group bacterium]